MGKTRTTIKTPEGKPLGSWTTDAEGTHQMINTVERITELDMVGWERELEKPNTHLHGPDALRLIAEVRRLWATITRAREVLDGNAGEL